MSEHEDYTEHALEIHKYLPLEDNEIRLLKVTPAPPDDEAASAVPFTHSLHHYPLSSAPAYETLSYTWGEPQRNCHLKLENGATLPVTASLYFAVRIVARHCASGYLWIDQICINQDDFEERGRQVKLMGQIYSSGERCLVWLPARTAPRCETFELVLEMMRGFGDDQSRMEGTLRNVRALLAGDLALYRFEAYEPEDEDAEVEGAFWRLYCVFMNEWFGRGWVFQEVVLAKECLMVLGRDESLSLKDLYYLGQAIDYIVDLGLVENLLPRRFANWEEIFIRAYRKLELVMRIRYDFHRPREEHPVDAHHFERLLSSITPICATTDPRDRIYAFLGLLRSPEIKIEPNYKLPITKVTASEDVNVAGDIFVSATVDIICSRRRLDILEFLCRKEGSRVIRDQKSPTWVPNLAYSLAINPFHTFSTDVEEEGVRQIYPFTGRCEPPSLFVSGKLVDVVEKVVWDKLDHLDENGIREVTEQAQNDWMRSSRSVPKPTFQTVLEALLAQGHCEDRSLWPLQELVGDGRAAEIVRDSTSGEVLGGEAEDLMRRVIDNVRKVAGSRSLFITEHGRLAMGATIQQGDEICIIHGCSNPVALRTDGQGNYLVKEVCFLEGWMNPWSSGKVFWSEKEGDEFKLI